MEGKDFNTLQDRPQVSGLQHVQLPGEREPLFYFRAAAQPQPRSSRCCPELGPWGGGGKEMVDDPRAAVRNVEIWKIKKLIKSLEAACGNDTGMVSFIIPPKDPDFASTKNVSRLVWNCVYHLSHVLTAFQSCKPLQDSNFITKYLQMAWLFTVVQF